MGGIQTDPNLNPEQKTAALNNQVQYLTDSLAAMSKIAGTPAVSSLLNFTTVGNDQGAGSPSNANAALSAIAGGGGQAGLVAQALQAI